MHFAYVIYVGTFSAKNTSQRIHNIWYWLV